MNTNRVSIKQVALGAKAPQLWVENPLLLLPESVERGCSVCSMGHSFPEHVRTLPADYGTRFLRGGPSPPHSGFRATDQEVRT